MTATHADIRNAEFAVSEPARAIRASDTPSRRAQIAGRVLSGLALTFLLFDLTGKLLEVAPAIEGTTQLGWPVSVLRTLGVLQLGCFIAYAIPRTAVLGAILWTGYLGGAVATHVRIDHPLFSHTLFPVYVAAMLWLGLWLRDPALRRLVPFREGSR